MSLDDIIHRKDATAWDRFISSPLIFLARRFYAATSSTPDIFPRVRDDTDDALDALFASKKMKFTEEPQDVASSSSSSTMANADATKPKGKRGKTKTDGDGKGKTRKIEKR